MNGWWRRNAVLVVLVAGALGLVVWYVCSWSLDSDLPRRGIAVARARLAACLTGIAVDHERPATSRLRAIQLDATDDWPKRCAPYAVELERLLATPAHPSSNGASLALDRGKLFDLYSVQSDLSSLLTAVADEPIVPIGEQTRDVRPPPPPMTLPDELPAVASQLDPLVILGDQDLSLVIGDQIACRFVAHDGGLEATAHCRYPGDALVLGRFGARYLRASSGSDLAVVSGGLVRSFETGEPILGASSVVLAQEFAGSMLGWDPSHNAVVRRDPNGTLTTLKLPHPLGGRAVLVGDQLVWEEHKHVVARDAAGSKLGPVTEVTTHDGSPMWSRVCSTSQVTAVLLEEDDDRFRIAVRASGAWTVSDPGPPYRLTCAGEVVSGVATSEVNATSVRIDRVDCTRGHCTGGTVTVSGTGKAVAAAAIGDATIVVWIDDVVRAVTGPLAQLATLPSFPIYDGLNYVRLHDKQTGRQELLDTIDVVGRGASAIVLLHGDGVKLLHVRGRKAERVNIVYDVRGS